MKKGVWLSFDLGVSGDYEGMYSWLDHHDAIECGDSLAFLQYEPKENLVEEIKRDIQNTVELNEKKNRVYLIYRSEDLKMKGIFLFGSRKKAPWTGYAPSEEVPTEDTSGQ